MPELPEVETILRGLAPELKGREVGEVVIRQPRLRWPIPEDLSTFLKGQVLKSIRRRAKYLLFDFSDGTLIIHLGMSGSLRILSASISPAAHDHMDIAFLPDTLLRYHDPRRFGAVLWTTDDPAVHPLLKDLGIEPLTPEFNGAYLQQKAFGRKVPVKSFIMNSQTVTGIGNIYAAEALFMAGVHPLRPAHTLTLTDWLKLAEAIREVLNSAIEQGGTTLKDFVNSEGKPGYFVQKLAVYGRDNQPCVRCAQALQSMKLAQRTTVFCKNCQI